MPSNVRVIPSRATRIRAAAQAYLQARALEIAFTQGDKRRIKSVAPKD